MKKACLIGATVMAFSGALGVAAAQETTSDWLKRLLDPATIDVKPYPESQLNRKISVDTIRHDDPNKRIAVYMAPLEKLKDAADYFEKTLQVTPIKGSDPRGFEVYRFVLQGEGNYPPKAKGLTITVLRSPWVDGKAQIQMEYVAPKGQ
jgi:hypothetical protein